MMLSKTSSGILISLTSLIILFIYLPLVILVTFSFTASRYPFFPIQSWSLRWYELLSKDSSFYESLTNSIFVSVGTSVSATLIGFFGAYSLIRSEFRGKNLISNLMIVPISIPLVLLAISLRVYLSTMKIQFNLFSICIGHLVYMIPLSIIVLKGRFERFPWTLEEAAIDLGASRIRSIIEISVPWMFPGIIGSVLLNFTFSFDEFIIAWFLTNFDVTLPIKIWTDLLMNYDPKVNAIGTIVLFFSLIIAFLAQLFLIRRLK